MSEPGQYDENKVIEDLKKIRELQDSGVLPISEQDLRERRYLALDERLSELENQESIGFGKNLEKLGVEMEKWSLEVPNPTERVLKILIPAVLSGASLGFAVVNGIEFYNGITSIPGLVSALEKQILSLDVLKGFDPTKIVGFDASKAFAGGNPIEVTDFTGIFGSNIEAWKKGIEASIDNLTSSAISTAKQAGMAVLGTSAAGLITSIAKPWERLVSRADNFTGGVAKNIGALLQKTGRLLDSNNISVGEQNG